METKEQILPVLTDILVALFELDEVEITLESKLYEELDLDSIDAVDMIVKLQKLIGKKVQPDDFKNARTVSDIVDVVHRLVTEK